MKICYVSMAFGVKRDAEGHTIDHDRIYHELIVPAVRAAGLACQRADDFAGSLIHKDIAKAVITADVMLADVSNGNANVMYELGIRHALRRSATVLLSSTPLPFNIAHNNALHYDVAPDGGPKRGRLELEWIRARLAHVLRQKAVSLVSDSPLYEYFPELRLELAQVERERIDVLQGLVLFPPHHLQYAQLLEQFNQTLNGQGKPYERRVFIMTKYCDGANAQLDSQLEAVIGTVKAAVVARGYHPQLAAETKLHPNLWENIECQMLACGRGIAIVEDRFNPKLNPNVAMEWGWMRAMKKPVLYLVEKAVAQVPADVAGLIQGRFDWDNPQANIPQLVAQDLP